jgi:purine-cytosine permease-like protein
MTSLLQWLENTSLSTTLRDSPNVFLYPTILAFHTLGLAFFVGISSAIALRVLGVAASLPLAPFRKFYPVMWLGFFFNAVSGTLLLVIEPTKFLTMVDFYVKLLAIAGAVLCNRWLYVRRFRNPAPVDPNPLPPRDRAIAVTTLFFWAAAITAGRLTAYDDPHAQWQTALGTAIVTAALLAGGYVGVKSWRWIRAARGARPARHAITQEAHR